MKSHAWILLIISLLITSCANATPAASSTPSMTPSTPATVTPRFTMLPTWTQANTSTPRATRTPSKTPTAIVTSGFPPIAGGGFGPELLIDRPTNALLAKPVNLVTMEYEPSIWSLNSAYPGEYMGYSLTSRTIYGCKLEPSVAKSTEGYNVEKFARTFGAAKFEIERVGQAGVLQYTTYCSGEGEDSTCYQMTPGDNHEGCTQEAEGVLASFKLIANPFYGSEIKSPYRWACQDAAGTVGLCAVSYSIPMNTLAFAPTGQAWAAGDDGKLLLREGQTWKEAISPATHPLYDISFSSATNGWAVGDGAEVLRWDGNQWNEIIPYHGPGEGPGGSTQVLYAVDAFSINEAWLVGAMKGIDGKYTPYALHWNGKDILEETAFPDCNCGLNAVLVRGKNDIYAAGGSDLGAIILHWDGSAWTSMQLAGADHLYTLYQAGDGSLWAGGIEVARDQTDTRGALFHWDGSEWQRVAVPPLTGGIYALSVLPGGQIVLGGEFTALRSGLDWQPITTDIAGYGWIVDMEQDNQNNLWALTHSGNIFELQMKR